LSTFKRSAQEQARFAKVLMERWEKKLDRDTVIEIRMNHPCGIPKENKIAMLKIKEKYSDIESRIIEFSKHLG
jgi:hypothetical protein